MTDRQKTSETVTIVKFLFLQKENDQHHHHKNTFQLVKEQRKEKPTSKNTEGNMHLHLFNIHPY